MNNNPTQPKDPEHLDSDCDSATHECSACGKKYDFRDIAPSLSRCCLVFYWRLQRGQRFALSGLSNEDWKETIDSCLSRGAPPGIKK